MPIRWKRNQKKDQDVIVMLLMAVIAFLFLTKSPMHFWKYEESGVDSSVFKTVAYMMSEGAMPYRDSFDHKGPLLYFLNYLGMQFSFYRGIWVIEFFSLLISLCFMYKIARLQCGKIMSYFAVAAALSLLFPFFEGGNLSEEYAMPFSAVALYLFLRYFTEKKIGRKSLFFCGFCFGAVCLLRPNLTAVWIVFCPAVLLECLWEKKGKQLPYFLLWFLAGTVCTVFPFTAWLAVRGCLADCIACYIRFNMLYMKSAGFTHKADAFFYFMNQETVIISLLICVYFALVKKSYLQYCYAAFLLGTLGLIAMSGQRYGHYGMPLVPAMVFPIASLLAVCESGKEKEVNPAALFIILWLSVSVLAPVWMPHFRFVLRCYDERNEKVYSRTVQDVCTVIEQKTSKDETISVFGNWDIIYLLSHRRHATRYSYQYPLCEVNGEIMKDYLRQLGEELPKLIVISGHECDHGMTAFLEKNQYRCIWTEDEEENPVRIYEYSN